MTDRKDQHYRQALETIAAFFEKYIYLIFILLAAANFITPDFFAEPYMDPDSYMRAVRIKNWLQNPSFFEQPIYESNYPYGDILHWTRPMDIIWLMCTVPFLHLPTLKEAVFAGGHLVSPLMCLFAVSALIYGLKSRFNIWLVMLGAFLFLTDNAIQSYFRPTYPDHHSLMIALSLYAAALLMRWQISEQPKYLCRLGAVLAIAVMAAIEGILLYAIFLGCIIGRFVFQNAPLRPAVNISKAFAVTLTICWLLNPPCEGWLYPDNGRISILYAAAAWLACAELALAEKRLSPAAKTTSKIAFFLFGASAAALILALCFGKGIFNVPLDDTLREVWAKRIYEMLCFADFPFDRQLKYYAFAAASLGINVWLLKRNFRPQVLALNLCLGLPLYALSLYAGRFTEYQPVFTIIPCLCLVAYLYRQKEKRAAANGHFPLSVWVAAISIFLFQQLAGLPAMIRSLSRPEIDTFSPHIAQNIQDIGGTLIADVFYIEKYMWDCNVNAVGTTYHRNRRGLIDTHNILYATDDTTLLSLLKQRRVTQILLFAGYDKGYYAMGKKHTNKLYYRLINRENIPPYLEEIPSPVSEARHYKVNYDVDFQHPALENKQ